VRDHGKLGGSSERKAAKVFRGSGDDASRKPTHCHRHGIEEAGCVTAIHPTSDNQCILKNTPPAAPRSKIKIFLLLFFKKEALPSSSNQRRALACDARPGVRLVFVE
jgi:hypothetical protein